MSDKQERGDESSRPPERLHLSLVPTSRQPGDPERKDELSAKLLTPIVAYLQQKSGPESIGRLAAAAGIELEEMLKPTTWLSLRDFEVVLHAARGMMESDDEFLDACSFDLKKQFGPMIWILRAGSPLRVYEIMERTMHFVSHVSRYEILKSTQTSAQIRYVSQRPEGRLICLSRQAWLRALPSLWGLPRAQVVEHSCIGRGDEVCEYHLRWLAVTGALRPVCGLLLGIFVGWLSRYVVALRGLEMITFPLFGALIGLLLETRRAASVNLAYGDESHNALEALGQEYAGALAHVLDMHHRNQEWNHVLEERIQERQQALDAMVQRVHHLHENRNTTVRSLSHDIKNPLQAVRMNNRALRQYLSNETDALETLEDNEQAIDKADAILKELLRITKNEVAVFEVQPATIQVKDIVERIRGTLRAMVMGRDIRISVFATRIAPETVCTDEFLLTRIIDNILTNATKYTERGSIVVECDGSAYGFCLKVSDSGRGIATDRLYKVFTGDQPDNNPVMGESHGIGLPTVVRLLDQLAGTLEVISKPNLGTTFTIQLPLTMPEKNSPAEDGQEPMEKVLARVVKIKRVANENIG